MNANTPAQPTLYADLGHNGQRELYCDNTGFSKREELSARFAAELIHIYLDYDTVKQYKSSQDMIRCWAETSVEMADALIKQWEK